MLCIRQRGKEVIISRLQGHKPTKGHSENNLMLKVDEALGIIENIKVNQEVTSGFVSPELKGFVVAEKVVAPFDIPSFNQSSVDGYAIKHHEAISYKIIGEVKAGSDVEFNLKSGEGVRIFTGAKIPIHTDSVVMQEYIQIKGAFIENNQALQMGQNIRKIGSQIKKNTVVMETGHLINPASLGILQSLGIQQIKLFQKPRVSIVLTGNELIKSGEELTEGKIFESNSIVLQSALNQFDIENIDIRYSQDSFEETKQAIGEALKDSDIVLISGGISVGDYDFVKDSLDALGVEKLFHNVCQKPGKPLYFGRLNDTYVFGLPGNPASTLNCFYIYVSIILEKFLQKTVIQKCLLPLSHDIENKTERALFLKSKIKNNTVENIDENNSATLLSFSNADALAYIPSDCKKLKKGEELLCWLIPK